VKRDYLATPDSCGAVYHLSPFTSHPPTPGPPDSFLCHKSARLGQRSGQSWSFLFIVILKSRKASEDPPRNHIAKPLGIAAASLCNGFIRGEVRMYIARDRPVGTDRGRRGVSQLSTGCVKSLARKWTWREYHFLAPILGTAQSWPHEKNRGDYKAF
jgi:hypothetical protein